MEPYQFSTTVQIAIGSGIADDLKVWWMSPVTVSMVVFAGVFGSAVAGMLVTQFLPSKHTSAETKEVVRAGRHHGGTGPGAAHCLGQVLL